MASLNILDQSPADLVAYASVPIAFTVTRRWPAGAIEWPHVKNYDAIPDNRPTDWPHRFDLSRWRLEARVFWAKSLA